MKRFWHIYIMEDIACNIISKLRHVQVHFFSKVVRIFQVAQCVQRTQRSENASSGRVAYKTDARGESWEGGRERRSGCEIDMKQRTCVHKHIAFFFLASSVLLSTRKRSQFFKVFVNKYLNPFILFCLDTLTTLPRAQALLVITAQDHGKASKQERRKAGST